MITICSYPSTMLRTNGCAAVRPERSEAKAKRSRMGANGNSNAFTLLEVLISMFISSFIILGMIQFYRNVSSYIGKTRDYMTLNRKICLLFDQMEKDLSTAFVPFLHEEEGGKEGEEKKKEEKKKEGEEENKYYFVTEIYEDEYRRIEGKKWQLCKNINFISTNPLQIYGEKRPRLARVIYELIKDKERSQGEKISYALFRRETLDLENYKFKELEEHEITEKKQVARSYLVADNIKDFYVECVTLQEKDEKNEKSAQGAEEVKMFVWGDKKETIDVVPRNVEIKIVFWDDKMIGDHGFTCSIPIISYPTIKALRQASADAKAMVDRQGDREEGAAKPTEGGAKPEVGVRRPEAAKPVEGAPSAMPMPGG
jgi:type II secretory pathway component PulJ